MVSHVHKPQHQMCTWLTVSYFFPALVFWYSCLTNPSMNGQVCCAALAFVPCCNLDMAALFHTMDIDCMLRSMVTNAMCHSSTIYGHRYAMKTLEKSEMLERNKVGRVLTEEGILNQGLHTLHRII